MRRTPVGRPLITVVMANYKGGRYIKRALDTVLAQTVDDIEVIVCDDASPDDSVTRILAVQRRDPRVRLVLAHENGGPARCRNRALEEARGEWIAVVDSDDMIHPERLERLLAAASRAHVDLIADDILYFHETGARSRLLLPDAQQDALEINIVDWILSGDNGLPPLGYLKPLIRATVLHDVRYDESLRIGEDYDFMLRLLLRGATLRVVPEPWYFYRRHSQSVSHRTGAADLEAMIQSQRRFGAENGPFDAPIERAMTERLARLQTALSSERLIAAVKRGELGTAAQTVARDPSALLRLGRAAAEHVGRRLPDAEPVAPALVVLTDNNGSAVDPTDAVLIEVPPYRPPQHQVFGGEARRRLWRQLADLARGRLPELVVRGAGAAYAAGFIPAPARTKAGSHDR